MKAQNSKQENRFVQNWFEHDVIFRRMISSSRDQLACKSSHNIMISSSFIKLFNEAKQNRFMLTVCAVRAFQPAILTKPNLREWASVWHLFAVNGIESIAKKKKLSKWVFYASPPQANTQFFFILLFANVFVRSLRAVCNV